MKLPAGRKVRSGSPAIFFCRNFSCRASAMNIEWIRQYCLSMPYATEQIQWGHDLLFKVGGKMFAGTPLEPAPVWLTFKADPEEFYELVERDGVIPAPYMARAQWVAMQNENALPREEVKRLVKKSYEFVFAKLPKKLQAELASGKRAKIKPAKKKVSWSRPRTKRRR
jgi:predicted DNA-binding protein (MmcQ/YjbR family)